MPDPWGRRSVTDGPLIVQSDKTLLLEVDHPDAPACRMAIAPFAELERSPEHVHTYRLTPLGLWNARAAGHDAESGGRRAAALLPLPGAARAAGRRGRDDGPVRPAAAGQRPGPRAGAARRSTGPCWSRSPRSRSSPACSAPRSTTTRSRCTRPSAAGSSRRCSSSAGRPRTWPGTSTARRTRSRCAEDGWQLRSYQREAVEQFWAGGSGVVVLPCGAGKTLVGAAAMAQAGGDHADPGDQHGRRPAVEARADRPHLADRGGDRRVLRRAQGDPAGHHRHVPGADHPARRRVHPPRPVRRPRLGPGHLRRGAPAAGADLPVHRRPAGPPPARPDRHAGPRGRPRGRRVLADRPEAVRRAVEGHRGAGLDRAGRVHRGAGDADRRGADGVRDRRARGALPGGGHRADEAAGGPGAGRPAPGRPGAGDRRRTSTSCTSSASTSTRRSSRASTTNKERERLFDAFRAGELSDAGHLEGGQLLDRPARGGGGDPGVGHVRLAPGGGAAARPGAAAQGRRAAGALLHGGRRGTRSTPSTPRTGSGSSPSRATRTRSSTPTTC